MMMNPASVLTLGLLAVSANAAPLRQLEVDPSWGIPGPVYLLETPPGMEPLPTPASESERRQSPADPARLEAQLAGAAPEGMGCPGDERFRFLDPLLEDRDSGPLIAVPYPGHNRLYVGTTSHLLVYDTSLPTAPVQVGRLPGGAADLVVSDGYLYGLSGAGTTVYDLSDPDLPVEVAHVAGLEGQVAKDIALDTADGETAFLCSMAMQYLPVLGYVTSMQVLEVSDPTAPQFYYYCMLVGDNGQGLAVYRDLAYVAKGSAVSAIHL